jgi:hypothetical protein
VGLAGRNATDPRILIALWLYAATRGVGAARELDRLCGESGPYQWLCGGVSLNYHTLSDFRVGYEAALDHLLTQILAMLMEKKLVRIHRVSQDGTRVRCSAGRSSFKKRDTLEKRLKEAAEQVAGLKAQEQNPAINARKKAARQRAAIEKQRRLEEALEEMKQMESAKAAQKDKPSKKNPPKASMTDPQARIMNMPDGGKRPAYNVQLAADTESRAIVGVDVTNSGNDVHEAEPMRQQIRERTKQGVAEQLLDGGYVLLKDIDRAEEDGTVLYMPLPASKKEGIDPHRPKPGDSAATAQWRKRMGTAEAKAIYKERSSTIETVNGDLKTWRGMGRLLVRGINKVRCVALWSALAYNLLHFGAALAGT